MTLEDLYDKADFYNKNKGDGFEEDVEDAFGISNMPPKVKAKIHLLAWDAGHSAGYSDVISQYYDLVDLARLCFRSYEKA